MDRSRLQSRWWGQRLLLGVATGYFHRGMPVLCRYREGCNYNLVFQELRVSLGISSMTLFSCSSAELWQCRLGCYSPSTPWQRLCLPKPSEADGRNDEKVQHVASGLSHCLVCSDSGRGIVVSFFKIGCGMSRA